MHWLKRERWKAGTGIAGVLLLLVFMVWVPVSAADAYERASGLAMPITGTVQATPTLDATVTALNKEKLAQEVEQLKNQNAPNLFGLLQTNAAILLSTLVVVVGGLIGLFRWFGDRRDAQDKDLKTQAEERFKSAVTALGDENEGTQVGGAILLQSFLHKEDKEIYRRYYPQIFDLAVAYLRLPRTSQTPEDPNIPLELTPLSQALIVVFKEVFSLARDEWIKKRKEDPFDPRSLDASNINLDNAFLWKADLKQVFIPWASLKEVNLPEADLCGAQLWEVNLNKADLCGAKLKGADLGAANLSRAKLSKFTPSGVILIEGADLSDARLSDANLSGADLRGADLRGANLRGADLTGVKGLSKEQLVAYKANGAIIDEDLTTSSS
jgi:hypothetical protein